ncbi:MAG: outer membrane protein assembly factor BamE [Planctomycetota bacterium]
MRSLLAAALLPLLTGCFLDRAALNTPFDPAAVSSLQPNASTADDVTRLLGAPVEVVQLGRRSAWRYEYEITKRAGLFLLLFGTRGSDTQSDRVWVFFDEADNVTHVGATFDASEAEYALPGFSSARSAGAGK